MNVAAAPRPTVGRVLGVDLLVEPAEVQRGLEEVLHRRQALAGAGVGEVAVDARQHLVGGGQAAGRLQHEDAVVAGVQHVELAVRPDVVDAGVGAGVGQEDEAGVEAHREAVGHGDRLPAGGGSAATRSASEQQRADDPGDDRGGEDADLGLVLERRVVEGQAGDEQRHGEADAGDGPDAHDLTPRRRRPGGSPIRSRTASHVKAVTPTSLPTTRPTTTPWVIDDDHAARQRIDRDRHPGVGEGEQRDDHEARPWVQAVLEPLDDGHRSTGQHRRSGGLLDRRHVEQLVLVDQLAAFERARRREQAEDDAGDRGVDARLVHGQPQGDAEHDVHADRAHAGGAAADDHGEDGDGDERPRRGRCRRSRRRR